MESGDPLGYNAHDKRVDPDKQPWIRTGSGVDPVVDPVHNLSRTRRPPARQEGVRGTAEDPKNIKSRWTRGCEFQPPLQPH